MIVQELQRKCSRTILKIHPQILHSDALPRIASHQQITDREGGTKITIIYHLRTFLNLAFSSGAHHAMSSNPAQ